MAKSVVEKVKETERKLEISINFLTEILKSRMRSGTWGTVSVTAVVEAGYVKEVALDDRTVVRDLPVSAKT